MATAAAVLVAALAGLLMSTWLIWQEKERTRAAYEKAEENYREARASLYLAHMLVAARDLKEERVARFRQLMALHRPEPGGDDRRGWEWYYLMQQANNDVRLLKGHTKSINGVAWSPSGRLLASAGEGRRILVWNTETWSQVQRLRGHEGAIHSIAWSPDGSCLASASEDGTARIWSVTGDAPGKELQRLLHTQAVRAVSWAPSGSLVATGGADKRLVVWDPHTGKALHEFSSPSGILSLAWSPVVVHRICMPRGDLHNRLRFQWLLHIFVKVGS